MKTNKHLFKLSRITIALTILLQLSTKPAMPQERKSENEALLEAAKAQSENNKSLKNEEFKTLMADFKAGTDSIKIGAKSSSLEVGKTNEIPRTGIPTFDSLIKKSFADQYIFNDQHQKKTFTQQYYSGIFIFIMVVVIVCMGLVLSFKQFKLNEEIVRHSMKQNNGIIDKGTDTASSMEVSKDGIKMNTAVIGLMILVISLVFFFLYLKFVYQIEIME